MKRSSEELKEQKKLFIETADIIDEMLKVEEREENGEDIDRKRS